MRALQRIQSKLWIISFPLAFGLIWLVVAKVGWDVLFNAIDNFSPLIWILTFFCTATELTFQLARSWVLLRCDNSKLTFPQVAKAGLAAFTAGSFTPGRVGDSSLILLLPGLSARAVGLTMVDRLMFWPPMHMLGMIGAAIVLKSYIGMAGVYGAIVAAVAYFLLLEWLFHKTRRTGRTESHNKFLHQVYDGFATIPKPVWRWSLLLGLLQYLAILFQFQIGLVAVGWDGVFWMAWVLFAALQFTRGFLSFTPGNLGISELVGMKLGEFAGLSPDLIPQVTFPFFILNTVLPAIIGFPLWIKLSRNLHKGTE